MITILFTINATSFDIHYSIDKLHLRTTEYCTFSITVNSCKCYLAFTLLENNIIQSLIIIKTTQSYLYCSAFRNQHAAVLVIIHKTSYHFHHLLLCISSHFSTLKNTVWYSLLYGKIILTQCT